jgi:hypothetical protein
MRAPTASNNELMSVLGIGAVIAAAIVYVQTYKPKAVQPVVVAQKPVKPKVVVKPARWEQEGVGPGWASGRGLGEGDFKFFGQMDHPFGDQPRYSGHPMQAQPLPWAPRPPKNDSHGLHGGSYMMPPMGGSMGPTRY